LHLLAHNSPASGSHRTAPWRPTPCYVVVYHNVSRLLVWRLTQS